MQIGCQPFINYPFGHSIAADEKKNDRRQKRPRRGAVNFYLPPLKIFIHFLN